MEESNGAKAKMAKKKAHKERDGTRPIPANEIEETTDSTEMPKKSKRRRVKCTFCRHKFSNKSCFYRHSNTFHNQMIKNVWISCKICGSLFPDQLTLDKHSHQAHSRVPPGKFICQFCKKPFQRSVEYFKHANRKHQNGVQQEWEPCKECKLYFPSIGSLLRHKPRAHKVLPDEQDSE